MIGGVTPEGDVSLYSQEKSLDSWDVIGFIAHLLRRFGRLWVVWDGSPIHRSEVVRIFTRQVGSWHLKTEFFPGYAPDLNPAESLWQHLKHGEMANLCCSDLRQLSRELRFAVNRVRARPGLVQSFFGARGLDISEFVAKKY